MAWTPVGSVVTTGDTGIASSYAFAAQNHTTGDDIFLGLGWNVGSGADISSIADTAGNTYHYIGAQATIGSNIIKMYYAYNITGHATNVVTINLTNSAAYRSGAMLVMTPPGSANPLNDADTGSGNSTSLSTPSLSVFDTDGLIVSFQMAIADSNVAGTGYTLTQYAITGDAVTYWAIQYKAVSAAAAPSSTCASGLWGMVAASFSLGTAPSNRPAFGFFLG
jgi:hypothetical protein